MGGIGAGLVLDEPGSTQRTRIGAVAGLGVGLGLSLATQKNGVVQDGATGFVLGSTAVGGTFLGLLPYLGHQSASTVDSDKVAGAAMAGASLGSLVALSFVPRLAVDPDLTANALSMGAILAGAGAGMGYLASNRDDAPVIGILGGGGAGLLLGGILHSSIDLGERDTLYLASSTLEGAFMGGLLPLALRPSSEVTGGHKVAGVATGGLLGLGLASLSARAFEPSTNRLSLGLMGSAVGAGLVGGLSLLTPEAHGQLGYGLTLAGTAAGLGTGLLAGSVISLSDRTLNHVLGGTLLGAAEGLVFAYGAKSPASMDYAGAGLVGASLGASLGIASGMSTELGAQKGLTAAGIAAWGTWMGGFAGAIAPDLGRARGGLLGLNVGALAGYGLLRTDWVEPRDFGWLSLAGALGTALGGGVGALFSSPENPKPVLAGLAVGPLVGLATGAIALPRLRRPTVTTSALSPKFAGHLITDLAPAITERNSAEVLATRRPSFLGTVANELAPLRHLFDVASWSPMMGALPPAAGDTQPAPFIFGVQGTLR